MAEAIVNGLCSSCENLVDFDVLTKEVQINVKKEPITVAVKYLKCRECGDEVIDPTLGDDPFVAAYKEYRARHGLFQPIGSE